MAAVATSAPADQAPVPTAFDRLVGVGSYIRRAADDPNVNGSTAMRWKPHTADDPVEEDHMPSDDKTLDGDFPVDERLAREFGHLLPVRITTAAYADCVAWTDDDTTRTGAVQDEQGRLIDVLHMAALALRTAPGPGRYPFTVWRVPRDAGLGDDGDIEIGEQLLHAVWRDGTVTIALPGPDGPDEARR